MSHGTSLIVELQNWPNYFVVDSIVNRYEIPFPSRIKESTETHHDDSFIRLLFDDNWDRSSYRKEFVSIDDYRAWPYFIRNKLMVYRSSKYYRLADDSSSSINVFMLNEDIDIPMLDVLLAWRNDSTSVSIVDSTTIINPQLVYSGNDVDLIVNYDELTPLSKLIYCLLDLEIYEETTHLESPNIISTNVLEYFFELYVNDKFFKFLSERGWKP